MRARNYSLRSILERMERFWVCCGKPLPYRQSAGGCVTSTSIRLPPRRESLAPPDGSGIHDLATLCSSQSPQSRILRAEYACGIIFPNPGMDQPLCLSDEVTSLFAALALTQSVRVF